MRRRLDLAATLVSRPNVLFLDEPTTGLDPRARAELWTVIDTLVDRGTTVVLTTQYLDEAERLADDIVVIDHGRVIARGDARTLKRTVGGDQVQVVVSEPDADRLGDAASIVGEVTGFEPAVDVASRTITCPTGQGVETVVLVAEGLTRAALAVDDLSLHQPTLDEVFLTLTGSVPDTDDIDDIETAEEAS
jgi:ABC-2 type transport system ATP-binding protein